MEIKKILAGFTAASLIAAAVPLVSVDSFAEEIGVWNDEGLVLTREKLSEAGIETAEHDGKDITAVFEIEANIPEEARNSTLAEAVVKCGPDWDNIAETHIIYGYKEVLDNEDWTKEHDQKIIENNGTFTHEVNAKMDSILEVRFGTRNSDAIFLKSFSLKDGDTVFAVYKDGKIEKPVSDDNNAENVGAELDIWSDAGEVMNKWTLADAGFDISKYDGRELTVTYEIAAAIPSNAKGWTSAQTVVKYDGNESHTIHFCEELLNDEGQAWVKNFENNIITNNSTFTYDMTAKFDDMFDVRFGTSNDKAFVLKSASLKDSDEVIASYNGENKTITVTAPVEDPDNNGGNNDIVVAPINPAVTPNAVGKELDIWSDAGTVMTTGILSEAGVNVKSFYGRTLTAVYEIAANVPANEKGWTNAQTVVKYEGNEKHTIHFCEELLSDEGQAWVKDFDNNVIKNNETFTYNMTAVMDDAFDVRFGTSNDKSFILKSVTLKDEDTVIAVFKDGKIEVVTKESGTASNTENSDNLNNSDNLGKELDIWSDAGTVATKDTLAGMGVDTAALNGKNLTVVYEIAAVIPEAAKGWTSAQTVVKYGGGEKHTIHFCEELLSDEGQAWVKDFDNNIIKNNETFTYNMTAEMDDMFEIRFGTSNDKAFVLKSVTVKDGDTVIADIEGTAAVKTGDSNSLNPNNESLSESEKVIDNSANVGKELDIWSEAGDIMTKWTLADMGVDVNALEGKTLTVSYEISAAIPEDAKGWTSAQTVVKYDGNERHTIHYCKELLSDEGQAWVKDFDANIINNNITFTYDMTAVMDDMFNVRFGTNNDKAFVLRSVTLKDGDNIVAVYKNNKADDSNVNTGVSGAGTIACIIALAACGIVISKKKNKK